MKKTYDRDYLYSRSDLQERGWTKNMMERHLPEPDDYRDNPIFKCAGAMSLWLISRVHRIENRETFQADMMRANARRAKAEAQKPSRKNTLQLRRERENELLGVYVLPGMSETDTRAATQRAIRQARDEFAPVEVVW